MWLQNGRALVDWSDEPYVRVYTRTTPTLARLGWEGRAVLWELMRIVDRSGQLDTQSPADDIAALTGLPVDVVDVGLRRLVATSTVASDSGRVWLPNFVAAQQAQRSNAAKCRAHRRKKSATLNVSFATPKVSEPTPKVSQSTPNDTTRHQKCRERHQTTPSSIAEHSLAEPNRDPPVGPPLGGGQPERKRSGARRKLHDGWAPNDTHRRIAAECGVAVDAEATQFRDHHAAKGTLMLDWDAAFRTWLRNAARWGQRSGQARPPQPTGGYDPVARLRQRQGGDP